MGHGHVTPNADGSRARCGGPGFCSVCRAEKVEKVMKEASDRGIEDLTPRPSPIMRFFRFLHLAEGKPRDISASCAGLAHAMDLDLPDGPEKSAGLRKLLEAKDCFVRAALALLLLVGLASVAGCDGNPRPPSVASVPYSAQQLDPSRELIEVDYEGRRHVFVGVRYGQGGGVAKLGDFPIPGEPYVPPTRED